MMQIGFLNQLRPLAIVFTLMPSHALAQNLRVGDQAVLYETVDETMSPVDMADMIEGRPLVLVTGSAT